MVSWVNTPSFNWIFTVSEIIKSRLDKSLVKGSGDRLTQPGRIAVAYATPAEGKEIRRHIRFLTAQGKLHDDLEFLDLDDMPDVRGLKAMRVGVDAAAQGGQHHRNARRLTSDRHRRTAYCVIFARSSLRSMGYTPLIVAPQCLASGTPLAARQRSRHKHSM